MSAFDFILRGGTVVTHESARELDVAIPDGSIAALGSNLGDAREIVDCHRPAHISGAD